ncbi:uncharacterized protein TNCV_1722271 [Trichonephila clavipes]|nr:uncharacterized protein TNCV_1722271 [Trichonephila clavipes]
MDDNMCGESQTPNWKNKINTDRETWWREHLSLGLYGRKRSCAKKLGLGTSFVFQQDNDPKHTANLSREWLLYNSTRQLKTPPQLPDNLWHKLDVEVRKHKISCKDKLKRILLQKWHKIPNSTTKTLVFSMRNRLQAVINAKATRGLLATDHVILNHGQVTWTTPEQAPPLLTITPYQREDVSALDRFNVHRCPTRQVFSGTGLEPVTKQATVRYLYHSATAATQ